ncbi:MAG: SPFH domain-containing protein [Armatimonadaceae bacterium]
MSIFNIFKDQFIDIIEWMDDSDDTLAYRFDRHNNEIKNGAKLIVRPGQEAIFVSEGQVADEFPPGTYTLITKNLPLLSSLQGWQYGFESPFKAEVYFFNTRQFTDLKWGTSNPITLRDPELGPVRVRAYGTYSMRIGHPATLLRQLVSTNRDYDTGDISNQLRSYLVSGFATWLGQSGISLYDFAAKYTEIGEQVREALKPYFAQYGLDVTNVVIENIGLPPEVEAALDKRTQMGIVGNMGRYTQFQAANAIEASARNPGGGNPAMDLAMGVALGQQVVQGMQGNQGNQTSTDSDAPPPLPQVKWYAAVDGKQAGPFDAETFAALLSEGKVDRETLVWKSGMSEWKPAGEVSELSGNFPPPLPNA